jgi:disulfide bond formation protein DsbB
MWSILMVFVRNNRKFWSLMLLSSVLLIMTAYYFQHVVGLKPCFLCIIQRLAVMAIGVGSLIILINPKKLITKILGNSVYILAALIGLSAALRQMYMQRFPNPYASCGPGFEYVLENNPIVEALPKLLSATGNCSEVDWSFLGLSMAELMIPVFAIYLVLNIYVNYKRAA